MSELVAAAEVLGDWLSEGEAVSLLLTDGVRDPEIEGEEVAVVLPVKLDDGDPVMLPVTDKEDDRVSDGEELGENEVLADPDTVAAVDGDTLAEGELLASTLADGVDDAVLVGVDVHDCNIVMFHKSRKVSA